MAERNFPNYVSTTALAKALNKDLQAVFQHLLDLNLITKNGDTWELTSFGKVKGGVYKDSAYGRFIAWPESLKSELEKPNTLTATSIGKNFDLSATRVNSILSELGWITRDAIKGWQVTELGKRLGGVQSRDQDSGIPYVRWPQSILINRLLTNNISETQGSPDQKVQPPPQSTDETEFRDKFKAEQRAQDGHFVRSKAEGSTLFCVKDN